MLNACEERTHSEGAAGDTDPSPCYKEGVFERPGGCVETAVQARFFTLHLHADRLPLGALVVTEQHVEMYNPFT